MTENGGRGSAGWAGQESLLHPLDELGLFPPGMVPDPLAAAGFLTGVHASQWHAIEREQAEQAAARAGQRPPIVTLAVCGALARVSSRHGVYDRDARPIRYGPCPACAWEVAIATGSTERELRYLVPSPRTADALASNGVDPRLTERICRAALARAADPGAEYGTDHPSVVQILAHATAHKPVLWISEDCAEDDSACQHRPDGPDMADDQWRCSYPDADAGCAACSLQTGPWAGQWEGDVMDECRVSAPCGPLLALAGALLGEAKRGHAAIAGKSDV